MFVFHTKDFNYLCFLIENFLILNEISLKYISYDLVDNMAAAGQATGMFYWRIYAPVNLNESISGHIAQI